MFVPILAFLISCAIGMIGAIIGLGGGFLFVPTLTLVFGFDPRVAVGTSLAAMIFSSGAATAVNSINKRVLFRAALVLCIPAIIFSVLASVVTNYIDTRLIIALFAIALLVMSVDMLVPGLCLIRSIRIGPSISVVCRDGTGTEKNVSICYAHLIVWGSLGGFMSGITGTSGGAYFVPALVAVGVPVHMAVATSLLTIIPSAVAGATTHAALGHISLPFLLFFGAGAGVGAFVSSRWIAPRICAEHVRKFFGVMLVFVAILMIHQKVLTGL